MRHMLLSLAALLVSAGILLVGGGLQGSLISVRANLEGFSLPLIGLMMSIYYVGFITGCLATPGMVRRAGHIRAFTALAAIAVAAILTYAIEVNVALWMFLRVVTGFCFAGLYMIIESWINEKTTNKNRGKVLSVYRIVDFSALTIGQYLLIAADPASFVLFTLVAILISLSIVPVALTRVEGPSPPEQTRLDLRKLWRVSPLSVAGAFAVGLANGSFWAIGPVFVQALDYDMVMVASFMSAAILAGAVAQWPVGYLSDLIDRRIVLIAVAAAASAAGMVLFTTSAISQMLLLVGAAAYGMFAMPMFGLCAAHANDHAGPQEFVTVSGGLLLVFGVGSIVGPVISPFIMDAVSPPALFAYTATVHAVLALFGLYRMTRRKGIPPEAQNDYVPIPRTTPTVFEIDPRNMNGQDAEESSSA